MKKLLAVFCAVFFLLTGCAGNSSPENTISSILNFMMKNPDKNIEQSLQKVVSKIGLVESTKEGKEAQQEANEIIEQHLKNEVGDYFADTGFKDFTERYFFYQSIATFDGVAFSITNIEVLKSETEDRHDFSATVECINSCNESCNVKISGRVYFEDKRIYSFVFDEQGELDKALLEIR